MKTEIAVRRSCFDLPTTRRFTIAVGTTFMLLYAAQGCGQQDPPDAPSNRQYGGAALSGASKGPFTPTPGWRNWQTTGSKSAEVHPSWGFDPLPGTTALHFSHCPTQHQQATGGDPAARYTHRNPSP
jgi:hypothetical protein